MNVYIYIYIYIIYVYVYIHIYIYIYICTSQRAAESDQPEDPRAMNSKLPSTPSPPINIVDFRGFDSSRLLILRGGNSHVR